MKPVTTRVLDADEAALSDHETEPTADRVEVLRRLVRRGLAD